MLIVTGEISQSSSCEIFIQSSNFEFSLQVIIHLFQSLFGEIVTTSVHYS